MAFRRCGYALSPGSGVPLYYELACPEDPLGTIVLSDGIGCDGYVWKYLRRVLAGQYQVVHWHYPGHGRSPMPDQSVGIPELADDLAAVLDDCDVDRAILFGHSMGVQVALETFRRHGNRVDGLVLVCGMAGTPLKTFHGTAVVESMLPMVRAAVDRAPRVFRQLARAVLPTRLAYSIAELVEVNGALLNQADFMPYLHGLSRVHPDYFLALLAAAGTHTAVDLLPAVDVPVLVVAGDRDGFTPPELSRAIADTIPEAELIMVEGGTHTAPLERPDLVEEAVVQFLERRVIPHRTVRSARHR
jgi:pimeloyl-ACP methyl ester carboxylesterase